MRVVEVGQYFVTRILVILDNFNQWLVANTPFHETTKLLTKRVDPRQYENWTCIGSHDQFSALQM